MVSTMQMPFNPAQVEILKLFSQGLTGEQTDELRKLLIAFRFRLLNQHVEKVAKQKKLTVEQINNAASEHHRTPYRRKKAASKTIGQS